MSGTPEEETRWAEARGAPPRANTHEFLEERCVYCGGKIGIVVETCFANTGYRKARWKRLLEIKHEKRD